MVNLSEDQVRHVAKLANLPVSDAEIEKYTEQLSAVLGYVEQLEKVDTKDVEPTFNVSRQSNVYHNDEEVMGLSQDLKYSVKRIIGGE